MNLTLVDGQTRVSDVNADEGSPHHAGKAVRLTQNLEGYHAQILVRLNSRRCFYGDPPEHTPGAPGRPRRHGRRFVCKDPSTWFEPDHEHLCEDPGYGEVRVRAWSGLHPKLQTRPNGEPYERPPIVRGTVDW